MDVPDWEIVDGKLHREFQFEDFNEAFGFMEKVAVIAEELDHHPDWSNSYNKVIIDLRTHDTDSLTEKDYTLATRINELL